jgi:endonuclease/exonuclease/phosphatase family metal-dependent hydrolase
MRSVRSSLLIAIVVAVGCSEAPTSIDSPSSSPVLAASARNAPIQVMTRNLYLGTSLGPLFEISDPRDIPFTVAELWNNVLANDFPTRAIAIADEIARTEPKLIGLQEVAYYELMPPGQPVQVLDYLDLLIEQLEARGLTYEVAATADNINLAFPIFLPPATIGQIRFLLRDVILARVDVATANPGAGNYATRLELSAAGVHVVIPRGWTAVDATVKGVTVRFVNTHLEAFHPLINGAQARELAGILQGEERSTILVGDINAGPGDPDDRPAYGILLAAGFSDAWAVAHPRQDGFTCCFSNDLTETHIVPDYRIDMILFRQPRNEDTGVDHVNAARVGHRMQDRVWSSTVGALLWPADHTGVVATLHHRTPRPVAGGRNR